MRVRSTVLRGMALGAAAVLFVALPASAHPFIRGGEAPVDSLATLTLDLAHGCGDETAGEGAPTTQVSLDVPEWMRIIDIPEPDGWTLEFEADDDGFVEVVTWNVDGEPTEPAPAFDMDVVVTSDAGEVGDRVHLAVFQACDDMSYRWVGTPDEPADDPAINLTLAAADSDSPAPDDELIIEPEQEPTEPEDTEEPVEATDEEPVEDTAEPATEDEPVEVTEDEPAETDDEPATDADPIEAAPAEDDDGGSNVALIVIIALVVAAIVGGGLYMRSRNAGAEG